MRIFTPEAAAAAMELQQLVVDYWREVDFNNAARIADFYTKDCTFTHQGIVELSFSKIEDVNKFYQNFCAARGSDRIVRHIVSNPHVTVHDKIRGTVNYSIVTYAKSGKKPIHGLTGPSQVTDIHLECRRESDEQWRIVVFESESIFLGTDTMSSHFSSYQTPS